MADIEKTVAAGQRLVLRGPKDADGKFTSIGTVEVKPGDRVLVTLAGTTPPPPPPPDPDPDPTPDPTPTTGVVGYGANVTGGTGGPVIEVRSPAELKAALAKTGKRIVKIIGSGEWKMGGSLSVAPDVTVDGTGSTVVLRDGTLMVNANNTILRNLRLRIGDLVGSADSLRAVTAGKYHSTTSAKGFVADHCEFMWAPDVGMSTFSVVDATFQYCIFAENLLHSKHSQSGDASGHGLGHAVMGASGGQYGGRTTIYRCLYHANESRNPRLTGVGSVDIIESAITGYHEGPQGAVFSLNILGLTMYPGDVSQRSGTGAPITQAFRSTSSSEKSGSDPASVYVDDLNAVGFTPQKHDAATTSPKVAPNLTGITRKPSATAFAETLTQVGAFPRDAVSTRIVEEARTGKGVYKNGNGAYPPTPQA